jgi:hypothetical protein
MATRRSRAAPMPDEWLPRKESQLAGAAGERVVGAPKHSRACRPISDRVRTSKQVPTAAHASDHEVAERRRAGSREPGRSLRDAGAEDRPADFGSPGEIVSGVVAADEVVLTNRSVDG